MAYHSFEGLHVWKKACDLCVDTYELMRDVRDYGLKDQMTRAAVSIPSNIAEGSERGSVPEFIRFLNIAKGSAAELRTQFYIANRIKLISDDDTDRMKDELISVSSMLQGLISQQKNNR